MVQVHQPVENILADELKLGTIEKVMAKSDLQLGIEALMHGQQQQRSSEPPHRSKPSKPPQSQA
jgi:hypothetical protein